MHQFLLDHRETLIDSCKTKVAKRAARAATPEQLANGIPIFIDQLIRTLAAEECGLGAESLRISGSSGGDPLGLSEIGASAAAHGGELLRLGFTVDAVVHDYGDLCQAITGLGVELDEPFTVDEFRTLNRCLDNAIADAVIEFGAQRDARVLSARTAAENERLGVLVHELRNVLQTASLAFQALEFGLLPVGGGDRPARAPKPDVACRDARRIDVASPQRGHGVCRRDLFCLRVHRRCRTVGKP